jgi:hypothetical protein
MRDCSESYDERHDRQRAAPSGYCSICGGEIYSDDEMYLFDGLCYDCYREVARTKAEEEDDDES